MPRVKIDYIVSFSSEDPENQASNLLAWDVSKRKWSCSKGEPSCSVVLQLKSAVQINSIQIGAYHAALVEVLVGLSERPNDPFEVLVPSSVFLSPAESRRGDHVEKVRSFTREQLSAARERRWDRVRVVCSQPYNKHCKYGLSFIHIHSPEPPPSSTPPPASPPVASAVPPRLLPVDMTSSDDEDFRPGELFAKHVQDKGKNTDAQIRQATSQALKNIPDSTTKLTKTPISKANTKQRSPTRDQTPDRRNTKQKSPTRDQTPDNRNTKQKSPTRDHTQDRQRDSLMYTDDDEQPNAKIDRVVNRHKDEKAKARNIEEERTKKHDKTRDESKEKRDERQRRDDSSHSKQKEDRNRTPQSSKKEAPSSRESRRDTPSSSQKGKGDSRKRPHSADKPTKKGPRPGPVSSSPHTLLQGVVFVLSGYENPRRGALRDQALAMGARFLRDWGPEATHLICAFPNTPKLRAVRASPNGASAVVVTGEWIEQCCARRRLLPWQWFATEPKHRLQADNDDDEDGNDGGDEDGPQSDGGNTDDEIERVMRQEKKRRTESPPSKPAETQGRKERTPSPQNEANMSSESDVAFVRDERIQGNVTIADSDDEPTDEETVDVPRSKIDDSKALPNFFDGYTFAVDDSVDETMDKDLLIRYVKAYGGLVIETTHLDADSTIDYYLCARAAPLPTHLYSARAVRADWVWRCHRRRGLENTAGYEM